MDDFQWSQAKVVFCLRNPKKGWRIFSRAKQKLFFFEEPEKRVEDFQWSQTKGGCVKEPEKGVEDVQWSQTKSCWFFRNPKRGWWIFSGAKQIVFVFVF